MSRTTRFVYQKALITWHRFILEMWGERGCNGEGGAREEITFAKVYWHTKKIKLKVLLRESVASDVLKNCFSIRVCPKTCVFCVLDAAICENMQRGKSG